MWKNERKMLKTEQKCTKAALLSVLHIAHAPFIEMCVCLCYKHSSVYGRLLVDHPFSTIH